MSKKIQNQKIKNFLKTYKNYNGLIHCYLKDNKHLIIEVEYTLLQRLINDSQFTIQFTDLVNSFEEVSVQVTGNQAAENNLLPIKSLLPKSIVAKLSVKPSSSQFRDPYVHLVHFLQHFTIRRHISLLEVFFHPIRYLEQILKGSLREVAINKNEITKFSEIVNSSPFFIPKDTLYSSNCRNLPAISKISRDTPLPLSDGQFRLAYLEQLNPHFSSYNWLLSFMIEGNLNIRALENSLRFLINRHESFRTGLDFQDKKQIIVPIEKITWKLEQETISVPLELDEYIKSEFKNYTQKKFDLTTPPLIRSKVVEIKQSEKPLYLFLCVINNCVFDANSQIVFLKELAVCYKHFKKYPRDARKLLTTLPTLSVQFPDYCDWLNRFSETIKEKQIAFWKKELQDVIPLEFPTDFPRPSTKTFNGDRLSFSLSESLLIELNKLALKLNTSLYIILLASFQCLLYRYCGQEDICTGTIVPNRTKSPTLQTQTINLIGYLANSIAIRSKFSPDMSVFDFIQDLKATAHNCIIENSDLTFGEVVNAVNPRFDPSRNPLFDTLFVFQSKDYQTLNLTDLKVKPLELGWQTSRFDLAFEIREAENGLSCFFEYNTDLFKAETIVRLVDNYKTFIANFSKEKEKIIDLPIISTQELALINSFNKPVKYDQSLCIHEIFEITAEKFPNKNALVVEREVFNSKGDREFEDDWLTYNELNLAANRVANALLSQYKIKPKSIVAICMERSLQAEITILGIFKAGCSILFLESDAFEVTTINKKVGIINPSAVIVDDQTQGFFISINQSETNVPLVISSKLLTKYNDCSKPIVNITIDDLALVAMTSGTTGAPKGVLVPHRGWGNWVSFLKKNSKKYYMNENSRVFLGAPYIFDASLWERILTYGIGGTLYVNNSSRYRDSDALPAFFKNKGITNATFTPSFLETLSPEHFPSLKCIFVVGEALSQKLIKDWKDAIPSLIFVNGYGPTEVTGGVTLYVCQPNMPVYIGKPIDNMTVYILDSKQQPVPIGVSGEIWIGGVGVASGYYQQPDKTIEAFTIDLYSKKPGARLYRTGDRACFTPSGDIDFKGRINSSNQVKLHGVRIDLEEIESILKQHPSIQHAFVKMWDDNLIAYIMTNDGPLDFAEIREFLIMEGLPTIKIPASFVTIKEVPLTKNGKLNRNALPRPSAAEHSFLEVTIPPKTATEKKLFEIWTGLCPYVEISATHNFRQIGGDSFKTVKLLQQINKEFFAEEKTKLALIDLPKKGFTIQSLGSLIDNKKHSEKLSIHISHSFDTIYGEYYNNLLDN